MQTQKSSWSTGAENRARQMFKHAVLESEQEGRKVAV